MGLFLITVMAGASAAEQGLSTGLLDETKITALDAQADDLFGSSVAVSGNTAVVGAVLAI